MLIESQIVKVDIGKVSRRRENKVSDDGKKGQVVS